MRSKPVKQRSDLSLGPEIALPIIFLGHLLSQLHSLEEISVGVLGTRLFKLRVLLLSLLVELDPLRNVESV